MPNFPYLSLSEIEKYIPEMVKLKVSEKARSKSGFIEAYRQGKHKSDFWIKKRNSFIARTLPSYLKNKTRRRFLSLIAWAFKP